MKTFWVFAQNAFCVIGVIFVGYFFLVGLFGGPSTKESFNPNKMSQVTTPPQKPLWEKPQAVYQQAGPVQFHGQGQQVPLRLPSWDEGFVPYAVWHAQQNPCVPNRPH